jgi:16S rRNA A1518/A1519 N6-dimethyltransferase RsmA/KsgA/DIM1 with predicted DNA glycosylase/AP lyase activity
MIRRKKKSKEKLEFGDFQTPKQLASEICNFLFAQGIRPQSVLEPTCGKGSFVVSCLERFDSVEKVVGVDINKEHLNALRGKIDSFMDVEIQLINEDFFLVDRESIFADLPQPLLVVGNPPWVTNSELGSINSTNLPDKSNFQGYRGLDAITGKSNFDISEWILIHLCDWIQNQKAVLAMLCKTSVARKVLKHAWRNNFRLEAASMHIVDAARCFNASVNACLLICRSGEPPSTRRCIVYDGISNEKKIGVIGMHNSELVADLEKYEKWSRLDGIERYKWRSGVKNDCAKVMELVRHQDRFANGLGELYDLEEDLLYPLFKSSDIVKNKVAVPKRWVLITQRDVDEDTTFIREKAPKTWEYLVDHGDKLDNRKSTIYKGRPRFCLFGVGDYAFYPWKVSVSGLYKKLQFSVLAPYAGKPPMVDDTCYYVSCKSKEEAFLIASLLNSKVAKEFLSSLIFWDSKRPITTNVLRRIDLIALAQEIGKSNVLDQRSSKTLFD